MTKEEILAAEKSVLGSLAVEAATPSIEGKMITRRYLKGEITQEKAIKEILKHHGQEC